MHNTLELSPAAPRATPPPTARAPGVYPQRLQPPSLIGRRHVQQDIQAPGAQQRGVEGGGAVGGGEQQDAWWWGWLGGAGGKGLRIMRFGRLSCSSAAPVITPKPSRNPHPTPATPTSWLPTFR